MGGNFFLISQGWECDLNVVSVLSQCQSSVDLLFYWYLNISDYNWFFMGLKLQRNLFRNQVKQLCIIETHYNQLEHPSGTSSHVLMKYKILKKGGTPTLNQLSTHGYWDHIFPRYRGWYPSVLKTAQYPLMGIRAGFWVPYPPWYYQYVTCVQIWTHLDNFQW